MAGLKRRLELVEAEREAGKAQLTREALSQLSDEDLEALEESLNAQARARGEQPPPNELLEQMKRWEAEEEERVRIRTEESRRRDRELLERNRALIRTRRDEPRKEQRNDKSRRAHRADEGQAEEAR
jgi:hypothetical protein